MLRERYYSLGEICNRWDDTATTFDDWLKEQGIDDFAANVKRIVEVDPHDRFGAYNCEVVNAKTEQEIRDALALIAPLVDENDKDSIELYKWTCRAFELADALQTLGYDWEDNNGDGYVLMIEDDWMMMTDEQRAEYDGQDDYAEHARAHNARQVNNLLNCLEWNGVKA